MTDGIQRRMPWIPSLATLSRGRLLGLEHLYVKAQVIFLFRSHRRDVAIKLFHACKNFIEAQQRRLVRIFLELVTEGIVNKSATVFKLLLGRLGHFANDGLRHPFAPLMNRKCNFRRRQLREQIVRQLQRNSVVFLGRIENHLAINHAARTIETFNTELFDAPPKRGFWERLFTMRVTLSGT